MIKLGNVELNPSMDWAERYQSFGIAQSVRLTLGGRVTMNAAPIHNGQSITLVADEQSGWLTKTVVELLQAMASQIGVVFYLTYGDVLLNVPVVFRHHDAPALDLRPLVPSETMRDDGFWIGSIKLMRV